tara:strand:- start:3317 stop:5848 length:2532 start_codon:yes stop_codon:yes gene_type:complete
MSLLDDVSLMITPNGVKEGVLFGALPQPIIGAEKVTDGDFPTGTSAWTTAAGWAIANGSATCSSGNDNLSQNVSAAAGKTYKITLDVTLTSGRLDIDIGNCTKQSTESSGTKTFYMVAVNTDDLRFYGGAFRGSVSNVSVREYTSADMDFTRATTATRNGFSVNTTINPTFDTTTALGSAGSGWKGDVGGSSTVAYSNGGVKLTRDGGECKLKVQNAAGSVAAMTITSKYKLVYDVVENNGALLRFKNGAALTNVEESVGTHTYYFTQTSTATWLIENYNDATNITLDNVYIYELLVEDVPRNLLEYSEDISQGWVGVNSPSLTYNIATAPDGTTTADGIQAEDATNYKRIKQAITVNPNSTNTFSIYIKKETSETNFAGIGMVYQGVSTKTTYAIINSVTGTMVNAGTLTATFNIEDVGTYWKFEMTSTDNAANTQLEISFYGTLSTNGTSLAPGTGSVRTIWGAQLEIGSQATAYIPTTDRLNVPRIDYTGGGCPHILVEPQRTNICLRSQELDNASWTKTDVTVTANSTTSPDGTTNAEKVAKDGVAATDMIEQTITVSNSTEYSISAFLKNNDNPSGGKTTLAFNVSSGTLFRKTYEWTGSALATATTYDSGTRTNEFLEDYGNGWYRVGYSFTTNGTSGDIEVAIDQSGGTSTTSIYMWGSQFEEGSYATSYIPTTSATVTRNAETLERLGIADLINSSEGVLYIETAALFDSETNRIISLSDGTNDERVCITYTDASQTIAGVIIKGGVTQASMSYVVSDETAFSKIAVKWKVNDFALWVDGTERATDSSGNPPVGLNSLQSDNGLAVAANFFYGKIRNIQVYKTALSDTQLGALTT